MKRWKLKTVAEEKKNSCRKIGEIKEGELMGKKRNVKVKTGVNWSKQ